MDKENELTNPLADYEKFQSLLEEFESLNKQIENGAFSNSTDEELDKLYDRLVEIESQIDEISKKLEADDNKVDNNN